MASYLSNAGLLFVEMGRMDEAYAIQMEYEQLVPGGGTLNARLGIRRLSASIAFEEGDPEQAERYWQRR